jgi:hypothetical protein
MHTVIYGEPPAHLSIIQQERCMKVTKWLFWSNESLYVFTDFIFRRIPPISQRKNIILELH